MIRRRQPDREYVQPAGSTAPPAIVDVVSGAAIDHVVLDLEPVTAELPGATATFAVRDGVLVVEDLAPAGAAAYRAMINEHIEHHVRTLCRMLCATPSEDGVKDASGRRVTVRGGVVYPPDMQAWPAPRGDRTLFDAVADGEVRWLALFGLAAVVAALLLVASGAAHPVVLLLVPGVALWASYILILRAGHRNRKSPGRATTNDEHERRARVQARSISHAVNRARALTT